MINEELRMVERSELKKINKFYPILFLILILLIAGIPRATNLTQSAWPDEVRYAKAAENLYYGNGFTLEGKPWRHQPPFFLLVIASSYRIFGVSEMSARIVSAFFGILGVLAIYYLGKYLYNEKTGLMAAFLLAVTPVHWFLSRMIVADVVLTTLITLTILSFYKAYEKKEKQVLTTGILIGLVTLTKRVGLIVYPIIGCYLLLKERSLNWVKNKDLQTMFLISLLLQFPWHIRNLALFRDPLISSNFYVSGFSASNSPTVLTIFKTLLYTISVPLVVVAPLGIFFMIKSKKKEHLLVAMPIIVFSVVFLFWGGTWIEAPRYLLPIVPFLAIMGGYGIEELSKQADNKMFLFFLVIFFLFTIIINMNQMQQMMISEWGKHASVYLKFR